jgi:transitional endoplasmic reticulum ATPase
MCNLHVPKQLGDKLMENSQDKLLKIAETDIRFVGKGLALVDPKVMDEFNLVTGDIIELKGKKKCSYVRLWSGLSSDYSRNIVRIDGYTRTALESGIDDHVRIKKIGTAHAAKEVNLVPSEELEYSGFDDYLPSLLEGRVVSKMDTIPINLMGKKITFVVNNLKPGNGPLIVGSGTKFTLGDYKQGISPKIPRINYEDIGGMKDPIQKVREMIELPIRHPELFEKIGIEAPKGVLLYGPPGTGKTLLAKAVANETNANFYSISGPEIMSKFYGESEERLRDTFKQAQENAPSIIFIDEIDSIAPKREEVTGEVEKRVVSQMLTLMDGIQSRGKVVVIGATNRQDAIDPALRRPGRFDREIELGIPDEDGRLEILNIHTRGMPLNEDVNLSKISKITHGFVGADLEVLTKEAAMRSLRRILPEINIEQSPIPPETLNRIIITNSDFNNALKDVSPSAIREFQIQRPDTQWDDIGGLKDVKQELVEMTEWPLNYPELYDLADIRPSKGILLYGPPGTGKTLLAKAVASNSEANFISIKGPELLSKWVGESEKGIREVFRKAKQAAPCIVFFDELDAIAQRRGSEIGGPGSGVTERMMSQMLTELDGLEILNGVVVIGATNRVDIIDDALLRPGRFDKVIEIPVPDADSRKQIIQIHTKKKPIDNKSLSVDKMLELTAGFTGAEIEGLVNSASVIALRDFLAAHAKTKEQNNNDSKNSTSPKMEKQDLEKFKITMNHFVRAKEKMKINSKNNGPTGSKNMGSHIL